MEFEAFNENIKNGSLFETLSSELVNSVQLKDERYLLFKKIFNLSISKTLYYDNFNLYLFSREDAEVIKSLKNVKLEYEFYSEDLEIFIAAINYVSNVECYNFIRGLK